MLTGGKRTADDIAELKKGGSLIFYLVHIIISTLGRLCHFVEKDFILLKYVKILCFDEVFIL